MAIKRKFKYTIYSLIILLSSAIYFALAYYSFQEGDIALEEGIRVEDHVRESGIMYRSPGKIGSEICYFKLDSLEQTFEIYRKKMNYSKLLNHLREGNQVSVYYRPNESEEPTVDVMQLEHKGQVIYAFEEYKKNGFILFYVGMICGIATIIGSYYFFRRNVLSR